MFTLFLQKNGGTNPASFQGVSVYDIPIVEDMVQVSIFLYHVDFVDGVTIRKLARRNVGKHSDLVRLLRYNDDICYVSNIKASF